MGEFINQVQKNNMLQSEILSEKQKRTLEREKRQFYKKALTKYQLQIFEKIEEDATSSIPDILESARQRLKTSDLTPVERNKLLKDLQDYAKKEEKAKKTYYNFTAKNNLENATAELYDYLQQYFIKYGIYIESKLLKQKYNIINTLCNNYGLNTTEKIKLEKSFDSFYNNFLNTCKKQDKIYKSNLKNNSRLAGKILANIMILIFIILILL